MTWWEWVLIGCAFGVYSYAWRHTVRLLAWADREVSYGKTAPPADIHFFTLFASFLLAIIITPIVMIVAPLEFLFESGVMKKVSTWFKKMFPPLDEDHKKLAREEGVL